MPLAGWEHKMEQNGGRKKTAIYRDIVRFVRARFACGRADYLKPPDDFLDDDEKNITLFSTISTSLCVRVRLCFADAGGVIADDDGDRQPRTAGHTLILH